MKKPDGQGGSSCEVVDTRTNAVIGRATSKNTAAGGSEVECLDFEANGKIILFQNSRGVYAKDARPGADEEHSLPCGEGVYASDASSCVLTDASRFSYAMVDDEPAPFDVRLCDIEKSIEADRADDSEAEVCTTLVTIPRGLNLMVGGLTAALAPRTWGARYCSDDRVVVVAEGTFRLHEAPSGRLLAKVPAAKQAAISKCADGFAETDGPTGTIRFRVGHHSLARAAPQR